jgi:hypothetical protein
MSFSGSGESLNYEFTFEAFLDDAARIEADVSDRGSSASRSVELDPHCIQPEHLSNESLETASLTESIFDYQRENGRTYHTYREGCESTF